MLKISNRLMTICNMVQSNKTVCDIASDHGYVPIYLINNSIVNKAIATDINKSSIDNIKNNSIKFLNKNDINKLIIRQGDGLNILNYNEADIIIISGVGFDLIKNMLSNIDKYKFDYLILSPQTKLYEFRKYILNISLNILKEKIVYEDNKFYFIFKINKELNNYKYNEYEYMYSKYLIEKKDEVLKKYILYKLEQYNKVFDKLNSDNIYYNKLINKIEMSKLALKKME